MSSSCWRGRERITTRQQRRNEKKGEVKELPALIPAAAAGCCDCLEAARGELFRARVAAIHSPVEEVDLVGVELQEEHDHFTAELMNLDDVQRVRQAALSVMITKYLKS